MRNLDLGKRLPVYWAVIVIGGVVLIGTVAEMVSPGALGNVNVAVSETVDQVGTLLAALAGIIGTGLAILYRTEDRPAKGEDEADEDAIDAENSIALVGEAEIADDSDAEHPAEDETQEDPAR